MRRRGFLAASLSLAASLGLSSRAAADAVSDALRDVTKARASIKTLVGGFTQDRVIGLLSTTVKSDGELTLVRPDRLRWELKAPDAAVYWITPEGFAFATPGGSSSVNRSAAGRFAPVLSDMMILLGGDLEHLRARYDVSVTNRDAGLTLAMRPKSEDLKKSVRSIELVLAADLWTMRRITIEETGGDRSVIVFTKVVRDVNVDPGKMKPPK